MPIASGGIEVTPQELALRFPVMVGATGEVTHEGRSYSLFAAAA
jgi:hypothetical protein